MTSELPVPPRLALVIPDTSVAAETVDVGPERITMRPERRSGAANAAGPRLVESPGQQLVIPTPEHRGSHDLQAGLPNWTLVRDRLRRALVAASRSGHSTGVLHVDVDGFTQIRDILGHPAGQIVLAEVARRLNGAARCGETVGRITGEEFVIVCEGLMGTPAQVATCLKVLSDRFVTALREPATGGRLEVVVTATIGAAVAPAPRLIEEASLLRAADGAMNDAKRAAGRPLFVERRIERTRREAGAAGDPPRRREWMTPSWRGFIGVRLIDPATIVHAQGAHRR